MKKQTTMNALGKDKSMDIILSENGKKKKKTQRHTINSYK